MLRVNVVLAALPRCGCVYVGGAGCLWCVVSVYMIVSMGVVE